MDLHGHRDALDEWVHTGKVNVEPTNMTDYTFPLGCSNTVFIDDVCAIILKGGKKIRKS